MGDKAQWYIPWDDLWDGLTSNKSSSINAQNITTAANSWVPAFESIYSWKTFQKEKPDLGEKIIVTGKDKINYYVVEFLGMESVRKYNAKYWKYLDKCNL